MMQPGPPHWFGAPPGGVPPPPPQGAQVLMPQAGTPPQVMPGSPFAQPMPTQVAYPVHMAAQQGQVSRVLPGTPPLGDGTPILPGGTTPPVPGVVSPVFAGTATPPRQAWAAPPRPGASTPPPGTGTPPRGAGTATPPQGALTASRQGTGTPPQGTGTPPRGGGIGTPPGGTGTPTKRKPGTPVITSLDVPSGDASTATCAGHLGGIHSAEWSPKSNSLVSTSHDGTAKIWDATTGG